MNNIKVKTQAHLALLIMSIIYAANYSIAKIPLEEAPEITPSLIVFIRVLIAGALFWLTNLLFFKKKISIAFLKDKKVRKSFWYDFNKNRRSFFLCGLFLVPLSQVLFFEGLKLTSSVNASVMRLGTPFMVLLFALWAGQEEMHKRKTRGLLLAGVGAVLLITNGHLLSISLSWLGDVFILISSAAFAGYMIESKKLMDRGYSAMTVLQWSFLIGFLLLFPIEYIRAFAPDYKPVFSQLSEIHWLTLDRQVRNSLIFVFFAATFLSYLLNISALDKVKPSIAGAYNYLQPLFAGLIALWFFEYKITVATILGGILVFTGLYMLNKQLLKRNLVIMRNYLSSPSNRSSSLGQVLYSIFQYFMPESSKLGAPKEKKIKIIIKPSPRENKPDTLAIDSNAETEFSNKKRAHNPNTSKIKAISSNTEAKFPKEKLIRKPTTSPKKATR